MENLGEYEFNNIFVLLGVENCEDINSVRMTITKLSTILCNNIRWYYQQKEGSEGIQAKDILNKVIKLEKEKDALTLKINELKKGRLEKSDEITLEQLQNDAPEIKELEDKIDEVDKQSMELQEEYKTHAMLSKQYNQTYRKKLVNIEDFVNNLDKIENKNYLLLKVVQMKQCIAQIKEIRPLPRKSESDLERKEEEYKVSIDAGKIFKTEEDIQKYIDEVVNFQKYVDFDDLDMSRFKYKEDERRREKSGIQPFTIKIENAERDPQRIFEYAKENGEKVKVYKVSRCELGMFPVRKTRLMNISEKPKKFKKVVKLSRKRGNNVEHDIISPTVSFNVDMLTIVLEDKKGNEKYYNCVMNLNELDMKENPNFYAKIVFSEKLLENAVKNNAGFIANINKKEDSFRFLDNKAIFTQDTVTILSYFQTHPYEGNTTLMDFYKEKNTSIELNNIIDRTGGNLSFPTIQDDNEGGR